MQENPYKALREDFEFLPNGYRLTSEKLAEEFADKSKPYYCETLKANTIRKIENNKRYTTEHEMRAYCLRFNTTADYLHGFTTVQYKDNESIEMVERITGLSSNAIEMLMLWKKERDNHKKFIPALGNDVEIINILLEYQLNLTKKVAPNYASWSIFHFIGQYLTPHKMKREQQDRLRVRNGTVWKDIEIGDTLEKADGTRYTIENTSAINSKTFSGSDTSKLHIENDENNEHYVVDVDAMFKSYSKDNIFAVLDKVKDYMSKRK